MKNVAKFVRESRAFAYALREVLPKIRAQQERGPQVHRCPSVMPQVIKKTELEYCR